MPSRDEKQLLYKETGPRDCTNAEILQEFLDNGLIDRCVDFQLRKLPRGEEYKWEFRDDLFQDVVEFLLTYDNEKMNNAYRNAHFNALVTSMVRNQIWSRSSRFFTSYIKFRQYSLPIIKPENYPDHEDE